MSENDRLHDALERQSELIAALRNEIALLKAKNAEQMKTIIALAAQYRECVEQLQADGKDYREGCKP
jgi:hypothetical protein